MYHILKFNKIQSFYHRHNFIISSQSIFFGDFFATSPASQRSATPPLQHVFKKPAFSRVAQFCSLPCFTENFAARFLADVSELPLDVALQLCQPLWIILHPSNRSLFTAPSSPSWSVKAPVASSGHFGLRAAMAQRRP